MAETKQVTRLMRMDSENWDGNNSFDDSGDLQSLIERAKALKPTPGTQPGSSTADLRRRVQQRKERRRAVEENEDPATPMPGIRSKVTAETQSVAVTLVPPPVPSSSSSSGWVWGLLLAVGGIALGYAIREPLSELLARLPSSMPTDRAD